MLVPAVHFHGGVCAEAIEHYRKALGAQVIHVSYYRDAPPDSGMEITSETRDHVMHAELMINGARINMCDVPGEAVPGNMFLLNMFLNSTEEVTSAFRQLKEAGQVLAELGAQFWTPMYGDVIDRFGVHWQLMANQ